MFKTKIKAYYSPMPVIDLSLRYLVRVIKPTELVVEEIAIPFKLKDQNPTPPLEQLKEKLARMHGKKLKNCQFELVECDILIPKESKLLSGEQ